MHWATIVARECFLCSVSDDYSSPSEEVTVYFQLQWFEKTTEGGTTGTGSSCISLAMPSVITLLPVVTLLKNLFVFGKSYFVLSTFRNDFAKILAKIQSKLSCGMQ